MLDIIRFTIQLPNLYNIKAKRIAKYKGVKRASWVANLVQARIESIYSEYLKTWERDAAEAGMSLDEFLRMLDSDDGEEEEQIPPGQD